MATNIPDFFGLDIGHNIVRIAEVKRFNENRAELRSITSMTVNEDILEDASEIAMKNLAENIKELKKQSGIGTNKCVIGIPEAPIFSRLITLPKAAEKNLEEAVSWELKPLIPVDVSEVDIAFIDVDEKIISDQTYLDIFAVAAPKTLTERYKKLAKLAGLELLAIETKALAVTRIVDFNYGAEADNIMVFQFDSLTTDLVLAKDGIPVFTQSVSTGADSLTKSISADYGIDEQQARQYRDTFGLDQTKGEGKIARSLEPIMQILVNELNRTLTYFREKLGEAGGASRVYICGEAASLPGLANYLTEKVGMPTTLVDPVANIKVTGKAKSSLDQLEATAFATAIGLGIKDR